MTCSDHFGWVLVLDFETCQPLVPIHTLNGKKNSLDFLPHIQFIKGLEWLEGIMTESLYLSEPFLKVLRKVGQK